MDCCSAGVPKVIGDCPASVRTAVDDVLSTSLTAERILDTGTVPSLLAATRPRSGALASSAKTGGRHFAQRAPGAWGSREFCDWYSCRSRGTLALSFADGHLEWIPVGCVGSVDSVGSVEVFGEDGDKRSRVQRGCTAPVVLALLDVHFFSLLASA